MSISVTGVNSEMIERRPRLLSDNGSWYLSGYSKDYLNVQDLSHTGAGYFTQRPKGILSDIIDL